jgi:flagellar biogenesis protein FliO
MMSPLPEVAADPGAITSLTGSVLRIVGFLLLLGACAWAWIRWQRKGGRTAKRDLQILDQAFFNRNASVAMINAAGRRLLLGISAEGVRLITELEPNEDNDKPARFAPLLREVVRGKEASK